MRQAVAVSVSSCPECGGREEREKVSMELHGCEPRGLVCLQKIWSRMEQVVRLMEFL